MVSRRYDTQLTLSSLSQLTFQSHNQFLQPITCCFVLVQLPDILHLFETFEAKNTPRNTRDLPHLYKLCLSLNVLVIQIHRIDISRGLCDSRSEVD